MSWSRGTGPSSALVPVRYCLLLVSNFCHIETACGRIFEKNLQKWYEYRTVIVRFSLIRMATVRFSLVRAFIPRPHDDHAVLSPRYGHIADTMN